MGLNFSPHGEAHFDQDTISLAQNNGSISPQSSKVSRMAAKRQRNFATDQLLEVPEADLKALHDITPKVKHNLWVVRDPDIHHSQDYGNKTNHKCSCRRAELISFSSVL